MMEGNKNNTTINGWKEEFAQVIAERLEMSLMAKDILSDEKGVDDRILPKSLEKNSPLLLVNIFEELIVILPYEEYKQLENGEVSPIVYIEDSYWSYGRYMGELGVNISNIHNVFGGQENSMIEAVFWQPIDKKTGIRQTGKLKKYFASASYSMQKISANSGFYFERVHNGDSVQKGFNEIKEDDTELEELQEKDYRVFLYNAMKEDIKKDFGLEVTGLYCHNGGNPCLIADPDTPNKVKLYISAQLHNYILYHPIFRNWKQYAKSFRFELGTTVNDERVLITDGIEDKPGFCQQTLEHLFTIKPIQEEEISAEPEESKDVEEEVPTVEEPSEVAKPKSVFGRIFNSLFKK